MGRREQPNLGLLRCSLVYFMLRVSESGCKRPESFECLVEQRDARAEAREPNGPRERVRAADPVVRVQVRLSLCGPVLIRACFFLREL